MAISKPHPEPKKPSIDVGIRFTLLWEIPRVTCKPVFALSNKIIFEEKVPIKTVCEPCFVDYQSTAIGILRNKGSSKGSFGREGKFLVLSVSQYLLYLTR